jgi:disulfide bond formation protein DsbB
MTSETWSLFFALLALACWVGTLVLGVGALALRLGRGGDRVLDLRDDVGRAALPLAWVVAAVTTLGSLHYSLVEGFEPCTLCWYQRICIYPWSVVLGIAAWRRDVGVRLYAIPVLAVGAVIAAYHSWIQAYPPEGGSSFCTATASCTDRFVWELGFVSLPFMSLSACTFMIALLLVARPAARETTTTAPGGTR